MAVPLKPHNERKETIMAKVMFYAVTSEQFTALESKNENALYFLSDTGELYKGSVRFSFPVKQVETFPETGESGVVYVKNDGEAKIWSGSAYITLGSNLIDNFVSSAVRHVVTAAEAGNGIYTGMTSGDIGILFTMNAGEQIFVRLTDLVDTYSADNSTAKGVTVAVSGYQISAEVNVSSDANNMLQLKNNGLYAAPMEWQTVE